VHFESFETHHDLVEKVNFYTKNDLERERVANLGAAFFREIYDFEKHGASIKKDLVG